mgnify:CR=1 FL=1|tara:strand:- start:737 stop:2425 length:1689 start_codon:yes stop_codon:yes gene_type:complete
MANVKITDLTAISGADLASNDVLPIVDINVDQTKKVAISDLQVGVSDANDFVTFTRLNANVNVVQDNAAAIEVRRVANVTIHNNEDTALQARITANAATAASNDFVTFTRLNANINVVQDNVASVTVGTAADTETRLNANLNVVQDNVAAVEARRVANTTAFTNEDTALQARITANSTTAASNDFVTFTRLNANINTVSSNAAAVETRRVANIAGAVSTITTGDLTASRALVSDGSGKVAVSAVSSTEIGHLDGVTSAIQTQLNAVEARRAANLTSATFTGQVNMSDDLIVTGNLTVNGDTTTVNSENKVIQDRFIMLANSVSGAPSADVGILFNRGTSGNAAFFYDESAKFFTLSETRDPDTNVAISPTGAANLSVGQLTASTVAFNGADLNTAITDNVATLNTADTALQSRLTTNVTAFTNEDTALQARITANNTLTSAVETRRTQNIAGAVSTITTSDLTASRALVSGSGGKVEVSAITSTELAFLDGIDQNINSNLQALAAGIAGSGTAAFPTGDYGILDAANSATDAFGFAVADLTIFDMSTTPSGELATQDLGALS